MQNHRRSHVPCGLSVHVKAFDARNICIARQTWGFRAELFIPRAYVKLAAFWGEGNIASTEMCGECEWKPWACHVQSGFLFMW